MTPYSGVVISSTYFSRVNKGRDTFSVVCQNKREKADIPVGMHGKRETGATRLRGSERRILLGTVTRIPEMLSRFLLEIFAGQAASLNNLRSTRLCDIHLLQYKVLDIKWTVFHFLNWFAYVLQIFVTVTPKWMIIFYIKCKNSIQNGFQMFLEMLESGISLRWALRVLEDNWTRVKRLRHQDYFDFQTVTEGRAKASPWDHGEPFSSNLAYVSSVCHHVQVYIRWRKEGL